MLTSLFVTLAGLIGTLGGVWVLALFVPTVAAVLKSTLDFARSPIGELLAVLALGLFLFSSGWISGDVHGSGKVRAAWRADTAMREAAEAKREADLRDEMQRFAGNAVSLDLTFSHSIDQKVHTYVAQTHDVACRRATGDDIKRLLAIQ